MNDTICTENCLKCLQACEACMAGGRCNCPHCPDVADLATLCLRFCARKSQLSNDLQQLLVKACQTCAASCNSSDNQCCQHCASTCQALVDASGCCS